MSLVRVENGPVFPSVFAAGKVGWGGNPINFTALTVDATGEKIAFIGEVHWQGAPASAKTMGASSKIHFATATVTMADAGTTVRIGIQDCITGSGTAAEPDGTYDVYREFAGNAGVITSADDNVAKSITLSTYGSKDITHGQLIAVVIELTARAGTDSLILNVINSGATTSSRAGARNYTTAWQSFGAMPNVLLEADDGTLGILRGSFYISATGNTSFQASTAPDERGLIFQVPFSCKIDALQVSLGNSNSAVADFSLKIYSTPLGTPSAMWSQAYAAEQLNGSSSSAPHTFHLGTELTLSPGVDYCAAVEATGTANVTFGAFTLANAAHRTVMGLDNCRLGTRSNGTGAFSETTTNIPIIAVCISALDDGTGAGRASFNIGV